MTTTYIIRLHLPGYTEDAFYGKNTAGTGGSVGRQDACSFTRREDAEEIVAALNTLGFTCSMDTVLPPDANYRFYTDLPVTFGHEVFGRNANVRYYVGEVAGAFVLMPDCKLCYRFCLVSSLAATLKANQLSRFFHREIKMEKI